MYDHWLITVCHKTSILVSWALVSSVRNPYWTKGCLLLQRINVHCSRHALIGHICSPCVVTLLSHFHQKHHSCCTRLHLCSSVLCSPLETSFFHSYSPIHEKRLKECHTQRTSITTSIQRYLPINS